MKVKKQIQKRYIRREPVSDYLKWWRVIRRFNCIKHDISSTDLDVVLYLYSESLFTYWDFVEYCQILGWDRKRFRRLIDDGWIHCWRNKKNGEHRLYELTRKGRHMCTYMYKTLNYESCIPETTKNNPVMRKKKFSEKVLAHSILRFNEEVRKRNPSVRIDY